MGASCPNCDTPALGCRAIRMNLRGTGTPVDAALCSDCGTIYVPANEYEEMRDRLRNRVEADIEREKAQSRLDTFK